jgi:inner membrane transporter RhtA
MTTIYMPAAGSIWLKAKGLADRATVPLQAVSHWIPPGGLVLLSSLAIQLAAASSKGLFATLGVIGTVFICKAIATLLLWWQHPPNLGHHRPRDYMWVSLLGVALALMNLSIFEAIHRIPMGVASTLEFIGPLGVAVIGSRRPLDWLWVGLATAGIILLNPMHNTALDPVGVSLALLSGLCWGGYIILSNRVGKLFPGKTGLTLAMAITSLLLLPFGIAQAGAALIQPAYLLIALGVSLLGTAIPYAMEFTALKRLSPRSFGVLMSVEPAIAALVGFLFWHEVLSVSMVIALVLITTAAVGVVAFTDGAEH